MTPDLPITGDPAIDDLPFEKRYRVCMAKATAARIDNDFLVANPHCDQYIRPAYPDEIPTAQPGEVWVVAVKRDPPDDAYYGYIRLPADTPSDRELSQREIVDALLKLGVLKFRAGAEALWKSFNQKARVRLINGVNLLVTC
jgi:hypothetical protein